MTLRYPEDAPTFAQLRRPRAKTVERDMARIHRGFLPKLRKVIRFVPFVKDAVAMYFVAMDVRTPFGVKATAASALAYFVMPFDALPDPLLGGYADDAMVIWSTLAALHGHIHETHIAQARAWLKGEAVEEA